MTTIYEHDDLAAKLADARKRFYVKTHDEIETAGESWRAITGQDGPFYRRRQTCLDRIEQPRDVLTSTLDWYLASKDSNRGRPCGPLILFGSTGTGKTEMAMALLRELLLHGVSVSAITAGDLMDSLRPGGQGDIRALKAIGCLFVDDVAAEKPSEFTTARLFDIVNARYERQLPTILTTNRTPAGLARHVGERTWSRLKDGSTPLSLVGDDRRDSPVSVDMDRPDIEDRLDAIGDLSDSPNRREANRRTVDAGIPLPLDARFDAHAAEAIAAICDEVDDEWTARVETLADRIKTWNGDGRRRLWNKSGTSYYEPGRRTKPERLTELEAIADRIERQARLDELLGERFDQAHRDDDVAAIEPLVDYLMGRPKIEAKPWTDDDLDGLESLLDQACAA